MARDSASKAAWNPTSGVHCPACGRELAMRAPAERANVGAWVTLTIGIALAPFLIGFVFILVALTMGLSKRVPGYYQCANCSWNSREYRWDFNVDGGGRKEFVPLHRKRVK
jgi:hypothetical protein